MRIKIASRQSDLAKIQAYSVGEALKKQFADLEVDYDFRSSLGDRNQEDPLWKMPEIGVFTQDFYDDLVSDRCDLVVHSWKDLPVESRANTEIVGTLERADPRDILLVRKDQFEKVIKRKSIDIFTSSPRRSYNLKKFISNFLPGEIEKVKFLAVRGNVPTRIRKLIAGESDGLVVAKAALDRILSSQKEEFKESREVIRSALDKCLWMVLPLTENPTAAAQGALAIEIHSTRPDVRGLIKKINNPKTFESVSLERKILASHGGGCHQKIGINIIERDFGKVQFLKGLTDSGITLDEVKLLRQPAGKINSSQAWPLDKNPQPWFEREHLKVDGSLLEGRDVWISKSIAVPQAVEIPHSQVVWAGGLETWKKLAGRGIWVNGSNEGLGEAEPAKISILLGREPDWLKLTHSDSGVESGKSVLITYRLCPVKDPPDLRGKTHFYWSSGSAFKRALEVFPEIRKCHHASGPGHTHSALRSEISDPSRVGVYLNFDHWWSETVQ